MKSIRRVGIVILLLGLTYIMRAIQPDWEQMARDNFNAVVANSWLFKLAALFVAGLLSYLMVYDMTRRESFIGAWAYSSSSRAFISSQEQAMNMLFYI